MLIKDLYLETNKQTGAKLIQPPKWLPDNVHYMTIMGSFAYGVSSDTSDMDLYGFCIPPKDDIFPHLRGEILGFGRNLSRFEQWQEHHVPDPKKEGKTYDFSIYSIVKYFQLCMENNPNIVDSLFTPETCVLHSTSIGSMVRENRDLFLHKGAWHKFKGYAYQQVHKMKIKNPTEGSKRFENVQKFGFDVKFAYHVVRLLNEIEQIMTEGTLDLQRNNEQLKEIRRGEWTEDQIVEYFERKEKELETLYTKSPLQHSPDEKKIRQLLMDCLEHHFGDLSSAVVNVDATTQAIEQIKQIVGRL